MKSYFIAYISCLVLYLILDGIWLGIIAKDTYVNAMGELLRESYPKWPWITFYLTYCIAIVHLVIAPHLGTPTAEWYKILFSGAMLGMAAYGAYNLTNYAIINHWPLGITIKDWVWGTSVTALVSTGAWTVTRYIVK